MSSMVSEWKSKLLRASLFSSTMLAEAAQYASPENTCAAASRAHRTPSVPLESQTGRWITVNLIRPRKSHFLHAGAGQPWDPGTETPVLCGKTQRPVLPQSRVLHSRVLPTLGA